MENELNTMQKNVENALSVWIMDILITYWQANGPEKYLSLQTIIICIVMR